MPMDEPQITCELVDERDLDIRYLAGRLSEEEASAFEAHYFECERCWALVKEGAAVASANPGPSANQPAPAPATPVIPLPRRRAGSWVPIAVAASLAIAAVFAWRAIESRRTGGGTAVRGVADSLTVRATTGAAGWQAAWAPAAGAASYRLRLYDADGRMLLERDRADTTATLAADSLAALQRGAPIYFEVEALDALRRPLVRTPLTRLRARADST
jgi:putative zinc finger protein